MKYKNRLIVPTVVTLSLLGVSDIASADETNEPSVSEETVSAPQENTPAPASENESINNEMTGTENKSDYSQIHKTDDGFSNQNQNISEGNLTERSEKQPQSEIQKEQKNHKTSTASSESDTVNENIKQDNDIDYEGKQTPPDSDKVGNNVTADSTLEDNTENDSSKKQNSTQINTPSNEPNDELSSVENNCEENQISEPGNDETDTDPNHDVKNKDFA